MKYNFRIDTAIVSEFTSPTHEKAIAKAEKLLTEMHSQPMVTKQNSYGFTAVGKPPLRSGEKPQWESG